MYILIFKTILWILAILGIVVLIHELGHFIAAKITGIKVEEFALGMGKKIYSKKIGDTVYKLNLVPFGGYVKLLGEEKDSNDPRSFGEKSTLAKLAVVLSGVTMNFVLAAVIFYGYVYFNGFKVYVPKVNLEKTYNFVGVEQEVQIKPVVGEVIEDTPADEVDFPVDVYIWSINNTDIKSTSQFSSLLEEYKGEEVVIKVRHNTGRWESIKVTPDDDNEEGTLLGIRYGKVVAPLYQLDYSNNKFFSGIVHCINNIGYQTSALVDLVVESFEERTAKPIYENAVGVVGVSGLVYFLVKIGDLFELANMIAIINLSLVMVNLLPVPALDGGQAVIILLEKVTEKKIPEKYKQWAVRLSFIFVITLAILINVKDLFQFNVFSRVSNLIRNLF